VAGRHQVNPVGGRDEAENMRKTMGKEARVLVGETDECYAADEEDGGGRRQEYL